MGGAGLVGCMVSSAGPDGPSGGKLWMAGMSSGGVMVRLLEQVRVQHRSVGDVEMQQMAGWCCCGALLACVREWVPVGGRDPERTCRPSVAMATRHDDECARAWNVTDAIICVVDRVGICEVTLPCAV